MSLKSLLTATLAFGMACAAQAQQPMQPSGVAQALMGNDTKDFFETAASANRLEIETGRLAVQRATDPKLKAYGQKMIDDHTKATEELQALATRKGVTLPSGMLRRHQMMYDNLRDERGEAFNDEYRDLIVMSHKESVSLFDQTAREGKDPDVKAFAQKMLPKLQQHGGEAESLDTGAGGNRNDQDQQGQQNQERSSGTR